MDKLINEFSFGLFFWMLLIFILLVVLLRKFAWKPILEAIESREEGIKGALDAAEKAKLEMLNLQSDNEKLLQEARAERESMMKEAREIKAKLVSEAKEEAQAEANKIIANAQVAIESEKKAAVAELKDQVASLSLDIASKVIKDDLSNNDKQLKLVKDLLNDATLN